MRKKAVCDYTICAQILAVLFTFLFSFRIQIFLAERERGSKQFPALSEAWSGYNDASQSMSWKVLEIAVQLTPSDRGASLKGKNYKAPQPYLKLFIKYVN